MKKDKLKLQTNIYFIKYRPFTKYLYFFKLLVKIIIMAINNIIVVQIIILPKLIKNFFNKY